MEKEIKNTVFTFLDFMNDKEVLEKMILTRDSKKKIFKLLEIYLSRCKKGASLP